MKADEEFWVQLREADVRIAELEEMLTAATDVATQRGKQLDAVREALHGGPSYLVHDIQAALERADGG